MSQPVDLNDFNRRLVILKISTQKYFKRRDAIKTRETLTDLFHMLKRQHNTFRYYYKTVYEEKDKSIYSSPLRSILGHLELLTNFTMGLWTNLTDEPFPYPELEEERVYLQKIKDAINEKGKYPVPSKENKVKRPLYIIHAHSEETSRECSIPEGIQLFHYCKKGCVLKTYQPDEMKPQKSISRDHACLDEIEVYDTYTKTCPYYHFKGDHPRHGLFVCDSVHQRNMIQIYSITSTKTILELVLSIQSYRASIGLFDTDYDVGIMACRGERQCITWEFTIAMPKHGVHLPLNQTHQLIHQLHTDEMLQRIQQDHPTLFLDMNREIQTQKEVDEELLRRIPYFTKLVKKGITREAMYAYYSTQPITTLHGDLITLTDLVNVMHRKTPHYSALLLFKIRLKHLFENSILTKTNATETTETTQTNATQTNATETKETETSQTTNARETKETPSTIPNKYNKNNNLNLTLTMTHPPLIPKRRTRRRSRNAPSRKLSIV